mmetsp:Transcript_11574/g.13305  ORF Transcript_11574/g.13305 Transcript_11574/m.13305 type:complete len:124 (+) Transcript_11574:347-718(+)
MSVIESHYSSVGYDSALPPKKRISDEDIDKNLYKVLEDFKRQERRELRRQRLSELSGYSRIRRVSSSIGVAATTISERIKEQVKSVKITVLSMKDSIFGVPSHRRKEATVDDMNAMMAELDAL